jgi:hypothetical protein
VFGLHNGSYLLSELDFLVHDDSSAVAAPTKATFEAVGKFLITHPRTPWTNQPVGTWNTYSGWTQRAVKKQRLSPAAYLGAASTLLISAEYNKTGIPLEPESFGPLWGLHLYLAGRASSVTTSASFPVLPVPDEFKELFKAWARHEIDFTKPALASRRSPASRAGSGADSPDRRGGSRRSSVLEPALVGDSAGLNRWVRPDDSEQQSGTHAISGQISAPRAAACGRELQLRSRLRDALACDLVQAIHTCHSRK